MPFAWNLPRGATSSAWRTRQLRPLSESALRALLNHPAVPYHEQLPSAAVQQWCRERGWKVKKDAFGNLVVRVPGCTRKRPFVAFQAHLDHPAMVLEGPCPDREAHMLATFWGGHPAERMPGSIVKVTSPDGAQSTRAVVKATGGKHRRHRGLEVVLQPAGKRTTFPRWVSKGCLGTWVHPLKISKTQVSNVVCDNLVGCSAILAGLAAAEKAGLDRPALAYFTRVEENGFVGCLEGLHLGSFDPKVPVLTLECSPKLPHVQPGDGPVARVGDRMSIYDSTLLAEVESAARELQQRIPGFQWQRKLMDGGACEATAFCSAGFQAAGMALPLSNYHNVPDDRSQAGSAPEIIHRGDYENLVVWVATLARGRKTGNAAQEKADFLEKVRKSRVLYPEI